MIETRVPVVELAGIGRTFAGDPPVDVLDGVDLTIEAGDYVSVTGTSGSGKSTLVNILGLLDRPSTGTYRFCGLDVGTLDERARASLRGRNIGVVFQGFHLMPHRTATENVAMGQLYVGVPHRARMEAAAAMLSAVGLGHRVGAMPTTLSGGERQRVAVARAMLGRPSLLLCDEPTGSLDRVATESVLALLDEVNARGLAVVVITHDDQVAGRASRRISLRDGALRHEAGAQPCGGGS